jgi:MFS family permease
MYTVFDEMFPVLAKLPIGGHGFGFSTDTVGVALVFGGLVLLVFQGFIFSPLCNRFGRNKPFRLSCALNMVIFLIFPAFSFVASNRLALWACLVLFIVSHPHSQFNINVFQGEDSKTDSY